MDDDDGWDLAALDALEQEALAQRQNQAAQPGGWGNAWAGQGGPASGQCRGPQLQQQAAQPLQQHNAGPPSSGFPPRSLHQPPAWSGGLAAGQHQQQGWGGQPPMQQWQASAGPHHAMQPPAPSMQPQPLTYNQQHGPFGSGSAHQEGGMAPSRSSASQYPAQQMQQQPQRVAGPAPALAPAQKKVQANLYSLWGNRTVAPPPVVDTGRGSGGGTMPAAGGWKQHQQQAGPQFPGPGSGHMHNSGSWSGAQLPQPGSQQAQQFMPQQQPQQQAQKFNFGGSIHPQAQQQQQQQQGGAAASWVNVGSRQPQPSGRGMAGMTAGGGAGSGGQQYTTTAAAMRSLQPTDSSAPKVQQQQTAAVPPSSHSLPFQPGRRDPVGPAAPQSSGAQQKPAQALRQQRLAFAQPASAQPQQQAAGPHRWQAPGDAPVIDLSTHDDPPFWPTAAAAQRRNPGPSSVAMASTAEGPGAAPAQWGDGPSHFEPAPAPAWTEVGGEELTPVGARLGQQPGDLKEAAGDGSADAEELGGAGDYSYLVPCNTTTGGIKLHRFNAQHWVYPKGVPERAYQLSCIEAALLSNTLVCLPTGLGKTLIAAVVMHNFTRWFPTGKVVFVAPTRPLVNQQIDACYNFMGVSKTAMAELTGTVKLEDRQRVWQQQHLRIVFATPQTFWNDVRKGICPYDQVVCLIVDECHRATGNYDIVNAVKHMRLNKCKFRVVGLSATPGGDASKVQEVIDNLMICRVEHRTESDAEVQPYVHQKDIQLEIVQPTREGEQLRQSLLQVLRQVLAQLCATQAYHGTCDPDRVVRFTLLQQSKDNPAGRAGGGSNFAISNLFHQGMMLVDLRDQIDMYGLPSALAYLNTKLGEKSAAKQLLSNPVFAQFRQHLEACVRMGAQSPKMKKLIEVLRAHFQEGVADQDSVGRVIIFANLRENVNEIVDALKAHEPLITARMFIGQSGGTSKAGGVGMKQKEQKAVLADFRAGKFNVLVATSIGEEGLDIPQVDLIVCYDGNTSPTRAIQRMGRTGRHKEGRVVYLLSAGRELEKYESIAENTRKLHHKLRAADRNFQMYAPNPRMLPREFNPQRLDVAVQHLTPGKGIAEKKSGRGRGRGSGKGRGSGRGKAAAAVEEGLGCDAAAADAGAEGDGLAEGAGAGGASGRGRGNRQARGSGTRGRGRGRGAAGSGRGAKAPVIMIDEEEGDGREEEDPWTHKGGPAPAPTAVAAAADPLEAGGIDGDTDVAELQGFGSPSAAAAEVPWSPGCPLSSPPASPVLGLLGSPGLGGRACLGVADAAQPGPGAGSPAGSMEMQVEGGAEAEAGGQHRVQHAQHALIFPQSAAAIGWDASGRLSIAPPPPMPQLQPRSAALSADSPGASPAKEEGPPGNEGRDLGQSVGHLPPALVDGGLRVGGGLVVKVDDPAAHRWAFLVAFGAQQHAELGGAAPQPAADAAPAAEGGRPPAQRAAQGNGPENADGKPACAVSKPASKPARKPRKRQAKAQHVQQQPPLERDQPQQPASTAATAAATESLMEATAPLQQQQQQQQQAPLEPIPTAAATLAGPSHSPGRQHTHDTRTAPSAPACGHEVYDLTGDSDDELPQLPLPAVEAVVAREGVGLSAAVAARAADPSPSQLLLAASKMQAQARHGEGVQGGALGGTPLGQDWGPNEGPGSRGLGSIAPAARRQGQHPGGSQDSMEVGALLEVGAEPEDPWASQYGAPLPSQEAGAWQHEEDTVRPGGAIPGRSAPGRQQEEGEEGGVSLSQVPLTVRKRLIAPQDRPGGGVGVPPSPGALGAGDEPSLGCCIFSQEALGARRRRLQSMKAGEQQSGSRPGSSEHEGADTLQVSHAAKQPAVTQQQPVGAAGEEDSMPLAKRKANLKLRSTAEPAADAQADPTSHAVAGDVARPVGDAPSEQAALQPLQPAADLAVQAGAEPVAAASRWAKAPASLSLWKPQALQLPAQQATQQQQAAPPPCPSVQSFGAISAGPSAAGGSYKGAGDVEGEEEQPLRKRRRRLLGKRGARVGKAMQPTAGSTGAGVAASPGQGVGNLSAGASPALRRLQEETLTAQGAGAGALPEAGAMAPGPAAPAAQPANPPTQCQLRPPQGQHGCQLWEQQPPQQPQNPHQRPPQLQQWEQQQCQQQQNARQSHPQLQQDVDDDDDDDWWDEPDEPSRQLAPPPPAPPPPQQQLQHQPWQQEEQAEDGWGGGFDYLENEWGLEPSYGASPQLSTQGMHGSRQEQQLQIERHRTSPQGMSPQQRQQEQQLLARYGKRTPTAQQEQDGWEGEERQEGHGGFAFPSLKPAAPAQVDSTRQMLGEGNSSPAPWGPGSERAGVQQSQWQPAGAKRQRQQLVIADTPSPLGGPSAVPSGGSNADAPYGEHDSTLPQWPGLGGGHHGGSRQQVIADSQTPQWRPQVVGRGGPRRNVLEDTPSEAGRTNPSTSQTPDWRPAQRGRTRGGAQVGSRHGEPAEGDTPESLAHAGEEGMQGAKGDTAVVAAGQPPARKRLKRAGGQQQRQQQAGQGRAKGKAAGRQEAHAARQQQPAGAKPKHKRKACPFIDEEAGVSEDEPVSGDEAEEDDGFLAGFINDDPTQAPPSTGARSSGPYPPGLPFYGGPGGSGPSPSPMAQFRSILGRMARGRQAVVQDTPGVSQHWGPRGSQDQDDDYDYEDSFLADSEEEEGEGGSADEGGVSEGEESHQGHCAVCQGDEGELLLCDGCPGAYHLRCVGLRGVPEGEWFCPLCPKSRSAFHRGRDGRQPQSTARAAGGAGPVQHAGEGTGAAPRNMGRSRAADGEEGTPGSSWGGLGLPSEQTDDENTFDLL